MPGEWRTPISLAYVWDSRCRNSTPCEQRAYLRESSGGRARHGTLGGPAQQGRHDGHFNSARASYNGGDWPSLCENARAPFSGVHFSHVDAISGDFSRRIRPLAILRGERKVFSHNLGRTQSLADDSFRPSAEIQRSQKRPSRWARAETYFSAATPGNTHKSVVGGLLGIWKKRSLTQPRW